MKDRDFLIWLHARLVFTHGENECFDYMHKLRAIIRATPEDRITPNIATTGGLDELLRDLTVGGNSMNENRRIFEARQAEKSCTGCYFHEVTGCTDEIQEAFPCLETNRSDNTCVIWVLVDEKDDGNV